MIIFTRFLLSSFGRYLLTRIFGRTAKIKCVQGSVQIFSSLEEFWCITMMIMC